MWTSPTFSAVIIDTTIWHYRYNTTICITIYYNYRHSVNRSYVRRHSDVGVARGRYVVHLYVLKRGGGWISGRSQWCRNDAWSIFSIMMFVGFICNEKYNRLPTTEGGRWPLHETGVRNSPLASSQRVPEQNIPCYLKTPICSGICLPVKTARPSVSVAVSGCWCRSIAKCPCLGSEVPTSKCF